MTEEMFFNVMLLAGGVTGFLLLLFLGCILDSFVQYRKLRRELKRMAGKSR